MKNTVKMLAIIAVGCLIIAVALIMDSPRGPVVLESLQSTISNTTYIPPQNIYLPEMMFLVVKDTDSLGITRCKNMAYRSVDSFSRRVNNNLVRADKKLNTLARIIYNECIDVTIDAYKEGL